MLLPFCFPSEPFFLLEEGVFPMKEIVVLCFPPEPFFLLEEGEFPMKEIVVLMKSGDVAGYFKG